MGEACRQVRDKISEILGGEVADRFGSQEILQLVETYRGREDWVECVVQSVLEPHFAQSNKAQRDWQTATLGEVVTGEGFVLLSPPSPGQQQAGSMGCGSSLDSRPGQDQQQPAMLCDMCNNKFSFISRKRTCCECGQQFCSSCLPRDTAGGKTRTCARCVVFNKRPPHRGELMKLRVKDLQHFLTRKRINIKSCVEKKDLVELVLQHSGVSSPSESGGEAGIAEGASSLANPGSRLAASRSWEDPSIRVSDQVPLERPGNFPTSYVESSHRRDWFQEKFGTSDEERGSSERKESVEETIVETIQPTDEMTPVETIINEVETEDEVMSIVVEDVIHSEEADSVIDSETRENSIVADEDHLDGDTVVNAEVTEVEGAVGGAIKQDQRSRSTERLPSKLNVGLLSDKGASSVPNSPRRFANQGMVYLSEIESLDDLQELSTKQVKELLAMNRVNFKGCVEKDELLKIVERLWKQEQRNKEDVETMDDDSLCKICMDSPIDCVMLECGHMCTCTNCGKQMAECPICRQYVVRVVKIFKA